MNEQCISSTLECNLGWTSTTSAIHAILQFCSILKIQFFKSFKLIQKAQGFVQSHKTSKVPSFHAKSKHYLHPCEISITTFFADTPALRRSKPSCTFSRPPFRTTGSGFIWNIPAFKADGMYCRQTASPTSGFVNPGASPLTSEYQQPFYISDSRMYLTKCPFHIFRDRSWGEQHDWQFSAASSWQYFATLGLRVITADTIDNQIPCPKKTGNLWNRIWIFVVKYMGCPESLEKTMIHTPGSGNNVKTSSTRKLDSRHPDGWASSPYKKFLPVWIGFHWRQRCFELDKKSTGSRAYRDRENDSIRQRQRIWYRCN